MSSRSAVPFVNRMVDLAQPKIIIATGGVAAKTLLDTKTGIMRLRGSERPFATPAGTEVPLVPMFHPAYLLRRPQDKSRAWRDLLLVQARLNEMGVTGVTEVRKNVDESSQMLVGFFCVRWNLWDDRGVSSRSVLCTVTLQTWITVAGYGWELSAIAVRNPGAQPDARGTKTGDHICWACCP